MGISSLGDVVKANLCTGCGICEAISGHDKVEMAVDHEGFYRPQIHRSDAGAWHVIKEVCPGTVIRQDENRNASGVERLWGPVRLARVGHSTDERIRWQASSGGALSAILIYLLETGKVDYVVQVGADKSDPLLTSVYTSRAREQVLEKAGSRYAPSAPLIGLAELLEVQQAQYAFVGKPCDIAALRAYGRLNPRVGQRIVFLLSFFCAGVPTLFATFELVRALGLSKDEVRQLRYRGFGWPGKATATDREGREYSMNYEDSWGRILGPRLQFRCKICPDGIGELADVTMGDAWHTRERQPIFEERPGQSLILARTIKGAQLLKQTESAGYLETRDFELEDLQLIQPYQKTRRQAIAPRLLAMRLMGHPVPTFEGFYLVENARKAGLYVFSRQLAGMLRRLVKDKMAKSR
jgi:coenzyme F420 hydrogenase subunit beta